jgi:hypothetical protein
VAFAVPGPLLSFSLLNKQSQRGSSCTHLAQQWPRLDVLLLPETHLHHRAVGGGTPSRNVWPYGGPSESETSAVHLARMAMSASLLAPGQYHVKVHAKMKQKLESSNPLLNKFALLDIRLYILVRGRLAPKVAAFALVRLAPTVAAFGVRMLLRDILGHAAVSDARPRLVAIDADEPGLARPRSAVPIAVDARVGAAVLARGLPSACGACAEFGS